MSSLTKSWNHKITPTGNLLHVNAAGDSDVASTSLAHAASIQAQSDAIHNNKSGALSP